LRIISYVSTVNPKLKDSEMNELFEFVRHTNNAQNITGILMYSEGNFFQVLEGTKDQLHSLFKKISEDSRHYNIIKIFDRPILNCSFSEYRSSFKVFTEKYDHKELDYFLREEQSHHPETYKNIYLNKQMFFKKK